MVEIKNLTKVYKMSDSEAVQALDHINLSIQDGDFVAIMGSSGSGKSTLLHMIACVDVPSSGEVFIDGVNIYALSSGKRAVLRRQKIGIIYQSYNLIPTLTVEENMILPLLLDKRVPDKEELEKLLELLQLQDRRKHLPSQLSGGQQQRTAIGRVLLEKPSVLLADEPTGNLDSRNTEEVMKILKEANEKSGQTILLITHDEQIGNMAKRKIILKDGKIL